MPIKLYFLFVTLMLLSFEVLAQGNYNTAAKFKKSELLEDLFYLENYLIKGHPGLYWYSSESDFQQALEQIKDSLDTSMTELDFLNQVAKLNHVIKCVHTDIRPSHEFTTFWKDSINLIPFNIMKVKTEYIISQNLSEWPELNFGTRLISINDVPIAEIVSCLLPFIPSDGDNQTRKFAALKNGFYRYYSYYFNSTSTTFKIVYKNDNGKPSEVMAKGIKKGVFDKKRTAIKQSQPNSPPLSFEILENHSTAILSIRSFRDDLMQKENIIFKNFISHCFGQLKENKTENLIIDLRGNGGGYSEYAAILYTFLTDTTFEYCKQQIVSTNAIIEGITYDIPATFQGYPNGIIFENGQYKWPKHSILGWRDRAENYFSGNIYFLINGGCSSTTSELASLARSNGIGTFIGEEVGGCYAGNSGGVLGWIELPNSKLRARIAMVKYEITKAQPINKQGVIPDFKVYYTVDDLLNGKDLEMELALSKIKERNTAKRGK